MAVVAAARPEQCRDWAQFRGWSSIPLYSAAKGTYILDYFAYEGADDPALVSMMNVFRKTPEGPGEGSVPIQNYDHAYFTRHVYPGEN